MTMERRTLASRAYRATLRPRVIARVVVVGILAWSVVLFATPIPGSMTEAQAETAFWWRAFATMLAAAIGIATLLATGFALGSKYVAEPAALRAVKAHEDRGAAAHPALVSLEVWDKKHEELRKLVEEALKAKARRGHE